MIDKIPFLKNHLSADLREIINGASIAFILKVIGAGFSFGFSVLLARQFGADGAGIYYLSLTVINIGTIIGRRGLGNSLIRFIAGNVATENWSAVKGVYQEAMRLALLTAIVTSAAVFIFASWLAEGIFLKPEVAPSLRWMSLSILPTTIFMLHAEAFKGLKRIRDSQLVDGLGLPFLSFLGLYILNGTWDILGAVWAYTLSTFLVGFIAIWLWHTSIPQLKSVRGTFYKLELLKSSTPLFWVTIMQFISARIATFFLGIWGTTADVGVFNIASRTTILISYILLAVNSIASPKIATFCQQKDFESLRKSVVHIAQLMVLFAGPLLLIILSLPEQVMKLFGEEFIVGANLLIVLVIGQIINLMTGPVGPLLAMSGNELALRNNLVVGSVINVILGLLLIPSMGALGAAIAASGSMLIFKLHALVLVRYHLKIWSIPFNLDRSSSVQN